MAEYDSGIDPPDCKVEVSFSGPDGPWIDLTANVLSIEELEDRG